MAVRSKRKDQRERDQHPETPTAEEAKIYPISTAKPAEKDSTSWADVI